MKIPFYLPDIKQSEAEEVKDALLSGWITTGVRTKKLENKIADFCNTEKAVCLNSATACMENMLRMLGVGPGDEVVTCAYTYTATASVIYHVGAKIVLVDTAENSYEMDYAQLSEAITERTKVVIPIDIGGVICDYDRILHIVESKKYLFNPSNKVQSAIGRVVILADAAHAFGASREGKMSGEIADFTSFSFHAVKNFTTAEGGALTWKNIPGIDNEWIYRQFQLLSLHGQTKDAFEKTQLDSWEYDIIAPYYKCNMTDVIAAIGIAQLRRYTEILNRRKEIIDKYDAVLKNQNVSLLHHYSDSHKSSGHLYLVRLNGKDEKYRNYVIEQMAERGISTNVHYKPLPMMTAYKNLGFDIKDYPNAFNQYKNEITLPLYTSLRDEELEFILSNFIDIISK